MAIRIGSWPDESSERCTAYSEHTPFDKLAREAARAASLGNRPAPRRWLAPQAAPSSDVRPNARLTSSGIHHGERGEIRSSLQQGQEEQLGALGFALNAVVHWNAIYMQEAIRQVRSDGMDVSDDDIVHLSR